MWELQDIPKIKNTEKGNFFLISGPCAVESKEMVFKVAEFVAEIADKLNIPFIFKASFDKANRTRLDSFRSIGMDKALDILQEVGEELSIPILTDVHDTSQIDQVSLVADVLQIPAFLCRQTDLLLKAGQSGKVVNIKKGQFLNAESMKYAKEKVESTGNDKIILTERGTTFGYNDLVVDFRNIPIMKEMAKVVLDCTHSVQKPNTVSGVTGGNPKMIETLARAGVATGVDGIFIETHPNPSEALSDGANMLPLDKLEGFLNRLLLFSMR